MLEIRKIVVPTDFSDAAKKALLYAVELATTQGSEIVLMHVAPLPVYDYPPSVGLGVLINPTLDKTVRDRLSKALEELRTKSIPEKVASRSVLRQGTAFQEILKEAADERADLIVIATRGRTGIKHLVLGSTAERVVREAPCPVLVVRDKENEFIR
jgi:nucleotide-binding universal stress UspA family protein